MKNLRKKNPLYRQFKDDAHQSVEHWLQLSDEERLDLSVRFMLLPVIQKQKPVTDELIKTVRPSAVDLAHQATQLALEAPDNFAHILDLLEKTTQLFLLPGD